MNATTTHYAPGPWVGMAAAHMWMVADLDHRDPVVAACWTLVSQTASVEVVLQTLSTAQLRPALNLAILRLDDTGAEIVVRGDAWAEITDLPSSADDIRSVRASAGAFGGAQLKHFASVCLGLPAQVDEQQPLWALVEGVVPAAEIAIESSSVAEVPPADTAARIDGVRPTEPMVLERLARPVDPHSVDPFGVRETEPTLHRFDALFGKTEHQSETVQHNAPVPEEWMTGMQAAAAPGVAGEQQRSLDVGEQPAASGSTHSDGNPHNGAFFTDVSWADVADDPAPPEAYHAAGTLVYEPPVAYQPAAYEPPTAANPAGLKRNGGIDPELLLTVQRTPAAPLSTGPIVDTVRCDAGHLNPPDADRCRVCDAGIPPQTPQPHARPRLGVLRLSTGEVVPLDRGVIIGRAPGAPESFVRDEPYRIQVPSPDSSISRRHVEVVLQGWTVTVVDLRSTNGTHIVPPAGPPQLLPPGGRRVIEHGWTVRLDESTSFRFEVAG